MSNTSGYRSVHVQAADGLRLFARDYAPDKSALTPLLCLPGLTRNSKDFEPIAPWLAQTRRVIALDFRGRGQSEYARDPASYRPDIELGDAICLLNSLKIERVALIGTSRGGIVGMLMAALFKDRLAGLFLNDVGPAFEPGGLLRIRTYLGVQRAFDSWDAASAGLKASNVGFETLAAGEWLAFAQRVFKVENGRPHIDYDPALAATFPSVENIHAGRVAALWELFAKIEGLPIAVVRGALSDFLSAATMAAMKQSQPELDATTVEDRGHAPFLDEEFSKKAIARWLERVDLTEKAGETGP